MSKMVSIISKNRIAREVIGLILFVITVFITSSLISYNPKDPSFNNYNSHIDKVSNLWGVAGSYLSDGFLQIFGLASYLFPIILFILSLRLFVRRELKITYFKLISYFLLILSTTGILSLKFTHVRIFDEPIIAGGIVGGILVRELQQYVNQMGAYTLLILLFICSLMMSTNVSLVWVISRIRNSILKIFERLSASSFIHRRKSTPTKKKSPVRATKKKPHTLKQPTIIDFHPKYHKPNERKKPIQREFDIPKSSGSYQLPPLSLLETQEQRDVTVEKESLIMNSKILEKKLSDFGVEGRVIEVRPGPVITMYEYEPAPGVKINRIVNLSDDLALALRAISIRIVAPIPGKSVVGIEVPNSVRETVYFKDIVSEDIFRRSPSKIPIVLGKDIFGSPVVSDLTKMPHLLIAGATGTGKSICVNSMICSVLFKVFPSEVKIIMIDPKRLELSPYDGISHLLSPVVTEAKQAATVLKWLVEEMERRYQLLAEKGVRNISRYNQKLENELIDPTRVIENLKKDSSLEEGEPKDQFEKLPYIMVIIDELADLMMVSSKEVEGSIARLAQMARAAGIHLVIATQRPSVDVLTGLIKVNFPARISFQVSSKVDSRTILDASGAEHLLGSGDMLFLQPGTSKLQRIHGAYLSEGEIKRVVAFIREQEPSNYDLSILEPKEDIYSKTNGEYDEKYDEAVELVANTRQASISMVQRHLRIGYNRAARIIEKMEEEGVIGPSDGVKPREVLVNKL